MEVDFTGRVTPIPNTQGEEVSGGSQEDSASPVPPLESSAEEVSGELVTMEGLEAIREAEKRKREVKARLQDEVAQDKVKSGVGATLAKIAEAAIYVDHHEKGTGDLSPETYISRAKVALDDAKRRRKDLIDARFPWEDSVFELGLSKDETADRIKGIKILYEDFDEKYASTLKGPEEYLKKNEVKLQDAKDANLGSIKVQPFHGDLAQYQQFKQSFTSLYNGIILPDHRRLTYLRQSLKGEALATIASVGHSNADYQTAWDLLDGRFENVEQAKREVLSYLLNLQGPKDNRPLTLRRLHDDVRAKYRKLVELDPNTRPDSTSMRFIIDRVYTAKVREEIEKQLGVAPPVDQFLDLAEEIIARDVRVRQADPLLKAQNQGQGAGGAQKGNNGTKGCNCYHQPNDIVNGFCDFFIFCHLYAPQKCHKHDTLLSFAAFLRQRSLRRFCANFFVKICPLRHLLRHLLRPFLRCLQKRHKI